MGYRSFSMYAGTAALVLGLAIAGCGGNSMGTDPGATTKQTPATAWSVSGTITFPANEGAAHIKMMATSDLIAHNASYYYGGPIALTPSGSPPIATFTLPVDATTLGLALGAEIMGLYVFNDVNENGVFDVGEQYRTLSPLDPTCAVWANGTTASQIAVFQFRTRGSTNTPVTGWYIFPGCEDSSCAKLIATDDTVLDGAKLAYYEGYPTAMQMQ